MVLQIIAKLTKGETILPADSTKDKRIDIDSQAKIRELEKQKQEEENSQIVQAVRSLKLTPAQLMAFLNDPKNSLITSGHTDPKPKAPEKEDTAHEEN